MRLKQIVENYPLWGHATAFNYHLAAHSSVLFNDSKSFPRSRRQEIHSASLWLLELHKLRLAQTSDTSLNLGYDSNNPHD